mmetsp:Transcript_75871/g.201273  ORF Transcript_75871/g.201273 Transcript_75871/m.201273 type:complete len:207 (-) Transcript_75871:235-855(-)
MVVLLHDVLKDAYALQRPVAAVLQEAREAGSLVHDLQIPIKLHSGVAHDVEKAPRGLVLALRDGRLDLVENPQAGKVPPQRGEHEYRYVPDQLAADKHFDHIYVLHLAVTGAGGRRAREAGAHADEVERCEAPHQGPVHAHEAPQPADEDREARRGNEGQLLGGARTHEKCLPDHEGHVHRGDRRAALPLLDGHVAEDASKSRKYQ